MPRTIAIGDIHGCATALGAVVAAIDPAGDDTLVVLGDFIDRGPDSRSVINLLMELGDECQLVTLMGNHEELFLSAMNGRHSLTWMMSGGLAMLDSYGRGRSIDLIPENHLGFVRSCVDYYETATHIFVHASYDHQLPLAQQPRETLRWEFLSDRVPPPHFSKKQAIVGHTSQKSGELLDLGHIVCIDTFCHGGGWLTAMDVVHKTIWQVDRHGRLRDNGP